MGPGEACETDFSRPVSPRAAKAQVYPNSTVTLGPSTSVQLLSEIGASDGARTA